VAAIYTNFVAGVVDNNPLSNVGTTLNSTGLATLPTVASPDFMWITLDPLAGAGAPEIVKVTTHTAAATSATITRAQQGTTGRQHNLNTVWRTGLTSDDTNDLPHRLLTAKGQLVSASAANTPAMLTVGANTTILTADSAQSTGLGWAAVQTLAKVCQLRQSTPQSIASSSPTALSFDTETLDVHGWHAGGNPSRITPTVAGWYQAFLTAMIQIDDDYIVCETEIRKNGAALTPIAMNRVPGPVTFNWTPGLPVTSTLIQCNGSTDYIEAWVRQQNSSAQARTFDASLLVTLVLI